MFIDFHKEEIDENINYKHKFLSKTYFQFNTTNSTTQGTDSGKNIIFNKDRKFNVHLFVTKYKALDKKYQSYIYIRKGDIVEFEGEKTITVNLKLHNEVPAKIYRKFMDKA